MRRLALVAAAWLALLAACAPFDLAVSRQLAGHTPALADAVRRYGEWPAWAVLIALLVVLGWRSRWPELRPLARATAWQAFWHPLVVTQTLKLAWGRVRYRDLGEFTPVFLPAGPGGGDSFPSGHVAMACVTLPLALHLRKTRPAASALLVAYVLVVAYGRVAAGAHYLTDVLFSLGLGVLFALRGSAPATHPRR